MLQQINNFHDAIVVKALEEVDDEALKKFLEDKCIDQLSPDNLTPAGTLAAQGNRQAAERLRRLGANVNFIAEGAAQGGYREYAEELRTQHGADVDWIALGAARGGYREYAEELRTEHGADKGVIAYGAAQGGYREYAEWLRTQRAYVNSIAYGAAQGGDREYAEELRTQHGADVGSIAEGAAQGGYREYAEELRTQHGAYVNSIAHGAARGGDREYAEELRTKHGANVNSIAEGAAEGGYREYAEELRTQHGADVNSIAGGAAQGGDREYAEELRTEHGAGMDLITLSAKCWLLNSVSALHYLSFINNASFRLGLGMSLRNKFEKGFIDESLITKAGHINQIMKRGPNYDEARTLVGSKAFHYWIHLVPQSKLLDSSKLPPEMYIKIASFLTSLSEKEVFALHKKVIFQQEKDFLFSELNKRTKPLFAFNFFSGVYDSAKTLQKALSQCTSSLEVIGLLEKEQSSPAAKGHEKYKECVTRRLDRFLGFEYPTKFFGNPDSKENTQKKEPRENETQKVNGVDSQERPFGAGY